MDKILKLYTYVDGGINDTPFPNSDNPIEIGAFRYDAKRMGGAPTITASVNYPSCLDEEWTDNVYAEFNGEKYYLKQTPTSSYDNADTMYKHDITLVSERVALDNVYFFDVVTGNPMDSDKPVSNSTKVVFFGDVREFARRLQASLEYSGLDYSVVVDDDVVSEEKLMSFEDQFFSNVLQEIYNTYEVPYYFVGKTIHIGDHNKLSEDEQLPVFAYGVDNALLSITKNNANYKIVNRATGTGSSDNIPFYYPNNSPKGDIDAVGGRDGLDITIVDYDLFSNNVAIDESLVYVEAPSVVISKVLDKKGKQVASGVLSEGIGVNYLGFTQEYKIYVEASAEVDVRLLLSPSGEFVRYDDENDQEGREASFNMSTRLFIDGKQVGRIDTSEGDEEAVDITLRKGLTIISTYVSYDFEVADQRNEFYGKVSLSYGIDYSETSSWYLGDRKIDLGKYGLRVDSTPVNGDTITQKLIKYVKTSQYLMPSIYRETDGKERFYNATNDTYEGVTFNNPFVAGHPKEHIIKVDDIKPSIEGMEYNGQRIDMFEAFAYDDDDNDETYEDEEGNVYFKHPYFFAKLKPLGFNLFDHAIEQQPMVVSFTSGDCGACSFEIAVDEDTQKNTVQVDENGNVKRDEDGNVLCGSEALNQRVEDFQDIQQDTTNRSVWIALRKEEDTYGILMPKAPTKDEQGNEIGGHRPSTEDTFVILGINLPYEYIEHAEKKLEAEIIKYLKENNDEKFTFSISFSRIYFAENPDILPLLSENSKVKITYNNKEYDLYVSSFSYSMGDNDVLPEIRVELDDTLKVSQNALQNAISEVKSSLGSTINEVAQAVAMQKRSYVSKVEDDNAQGVVNFTKGIKFGEGGKVEVMDNNSAKLTIEYLEVTKKASFTSLEIQEKTHVGGQILVTPASINCGEVEELDDVYRCYFQTKGTDGDEIFNQFAVGDQAVCQTYNAWGSVYYWRLVTGIGEDYIDLSKTDCDEDSGIPKAGDKIIQLGNRADVERQNAIVIAAYGDGSPYIIQYKGINSFEIGDDKVVTKLSSTENIFTGKVHMEMGSDGVENLNLEIGGQNLLRNSGFTGDFVTESLDEKSVLDENDEMFSNPLRHWITEGNVAVIDSKASQSGKECRLLGSSLKQELMYPIIEGESYVLSFRARGRNLTYSVGGITKEIALTGKQARVIEKFTATSGENMFAITNANATICEIQLERGNVVSAWGHSMWDNQSEIAKYQALNYLESAIKNGSTDILGGLIMSNIMLLGNPQAGDNTAGVSGIYNDDNDVAFWGGGTYSQAIETVMKYVEDPNYQPTDAEVASMAKAVITHGGRAILNDTILRGIIYAKGGSFGDLKIGKYVNACGSEDAESSVYSESKHSVGDENYSTAVKFSSGSISSVSSKYNSLFCTKGNELVIDSDFDLSKNLYKALIYLYGNNIAALRIRSGDIVHESGMYRGLRLPTKVITTSYNISYEEDCVIIADTGNRSLTLSILAATEYEDGSFVEIHNVGNGTVVLESDFACISYNGVIAIRHTIDNTHKSIKLICSRTTNLWYVTW